MNVTASVRAQRRSGRVVRGLAAAAGVLLAVAGCSTGATGSLDLSTPAKIAAALNAHGFVCTDYTANPQAFGPTASGECTHNGDYISLSVFASAAMRDQLVAQLGGWWDGTSVVGGAWLVTTSSAAEAKAAQAAIGGTVK